MMLNRKLIDYLRDPLRKNSSFLMGSYLISSVFGFLFWIVTAHYYLPSDLGLASAIISAASLLVSLSLLGLDTGIIRFLPDEEDKQAMINSCFTIVSLFSVILAVCFVAGLNIWSPALLFLRKDMIGLVSFTLLVITYSLFYLQNSVFISFRATEFSFIQSIVAGLRILLPAFLLGLGALGIMVSFGTGFFIAVIAANFFIRKLYPLYRPVPQIKKEVLNKIVYFSFGNYIVDISGSLTGNLWPILLLNLMNPETSAYFYIVWLIAASLFGVSSWTGSSLLAEACNNPLELRSQMLKAVKFIFLILIPTILLLLLFGYYFLSLFGRAYAESASGLLYVLAISSIPVAFNELYLTVCRVDKKIKPMIYIRLFISLVSIGGGYLLLQLMGLTGIGIAWLISQIIVAMIVVPRLLIRTGISIKKTAKC